MFVSYWFNSNILFSPQAFLVPEYSTYHTFSFLHYLSSSAGFTWFLEVVLFFPIALFSCKHKFVCDSALFLRLGKDKVQTSGGRDGQYFFKF